MKVEPPQAEFELINSAAVSGCIAVASRGGVSFVVRSHSSTFERGALQ